MENLILLFLGISLLFYVLLGGADFGGGIVEYFTGNKGINTVSKAIAPVWEANHVWLILVIVILFVGFPEVYTSISTYMHIPLLLILVGIIFRGSAFAFRYYDIDEGSYKQLYTSFFRIFSIFTPFFLGVTLGSVILGEITTDLSKGFVDIYIYPWINWFSMSMGVFVTILFTFLASVFLIGETEEKARAKMQKITKFSLVALIIAGGFVFIMAEIDGLHLLNQFFRSPISLIAIGIATVMLPFLWRLINKPNDLWLRLIAGAQTTLIVVGWFAVQFPVLVKIEGGNNLTIYNAIAPDEVISNLLIALAIGTMIIIPSIIYLFKVFKFDNTPY